MFHLIRRVSAPEPDDIVGTTKNKHFIIIYDVLFSIGWTFLSLIFITAVLSRRVQRKPMWVVSVAAWVIYSFSNLMLVGAQDDSPPTPSVCLIQAMFIYASPVFCAISVASFLFQTYCYLTQSPKLKQLVNRKGLNNLFYIIPISVSVLVLLISLIIGLANPDTVQKDPSRMYCHIVNPLLSMLSAGITIIGMLLIYTCEVFILVLLHKTLGIRPISQSLIIRMGIFSIWALVILILSFLQYMPSIVPLDNSKVEIIQGTLPCIGAIAFGTTRDLFEISSTCVNEPTESDLLVLSLMHEGPTTRSCIWFGRLAPWWSILNNALLCLTEASQCQAQRHLESDVPYSTRFRVSERGMYARSR